MIKKEKSGFVTVLQMEQGKVNALDMELLTELKSEFEQLRESGAKAVVLTGAGSSFSAGVDLFRILNGGKAYLNSFLPALNNAVLNLFTFPKPVVAAVNGHAIAGGCVLVCACDYRIMSKGEGRIGVPELLVGVPFPSIPLEIMRFVVPKPRLQEVIYLGQTYLPEQAQKYGLIDEIVTPEDVLERACKQAERLAAIPEETFQVTKRLLRQPLIENYERFGKKFDSETSEIWGSAKIHDVIRNYLEKTIGKR
ncbi:MAG: enoyl-CoA hydratase/isomerase family protein [bacterium]